MLLIAELKWEQRRLRVCCRNTDVEIMKTLRGWQQNKKQGANMKITLKEQPTGFHDNQF